MLTGIRWWSCKSFLHRLFPPSCWLLLCLPDDISIMENLLVVNSQNNSLYGTFFCYFYIIWIFLRHICTIFFYLYFKWIILFFSCIINLSQSDTVMKIRTIFFIFTGPCTNYFLEMRDSGMEKRQRYQGFRKFSIRTRKKTR